MIATNPPFCSGRIAQKKGRGRILELLCLACGSLWQRATGPPPPRHDLDATQSLTGPEWFRDAKLGVWAHWTALVRLLGGTQTLDWKQNAGALLIHKAQSWPCVHGVCLSLASSRESVRIR